MTTTATEALSAELYDWLLDRDPRLVAEFHVERIAAHRDATGRHHEAMNDVLHRVLPSSAPDHADDDRLLCVEEEDGSLAYYRRCDEPPSAPAPGDGADPQPA